MSAAEQPATNIALAQLAASGNSFALGQLWELNKGLLHTLFWKWYPSHKDLADAHGMTADDFEQEGFFAVEYAAKTYDPARGAFTTWLSQAMRRQISLAMSNGHRRSFADSDGNIYTTSADPLNHCSSLDIKANPENPESSTIGELQPDPTAEQAFADAETRLFNAELRQVIDDVLDRCDPSEGASIRHRYYSGLSLAATGEKMGLTASQVRTVEGRALRKLRSDVRLNRWHDAVIAGESWRGTGLTAWQNGGSVEERAIEWLEKLESSR